MSRHPSLAGLPSGFMNTLVGGMIGATVCPDTILNRIRAWGLDTETAEEHYHDCKTYFNRLTIAQALGLAQIVWREHPITLRGAFYRAVSAGIYPDTGDAHYRQCGNILLKLRRAGIVGYRCIVDSTRRRLKPSSWSGLSDFADTVAQAYRKDLWARQPLYLELFVEKDAMAAVIEPVTREYDIHLNIIRGSCSESFVWQIAQEWNSIEKPIFAYYLGDHDPAGLDIERDLRTRIGDMTDRLFDWTRMAITEGDFRRADLLGFAIKGDRTRKAWQTKHREYLRLYGDRCVEVDAIPANEIRERVKTIIEAHIIPAEWNALRHIEAIERQSVKEFALAQKEQAAENDQYEGRYDA